MSIHKIPKAPAFSPGLEDKIQRLKARRISHQLGPWQMDSKLLLAPMAGIGKAPFRLLMEDLGAAGTVSELISCHGINYRNRHTEQLLYIDPQERRVGVQLFGEEGLSLAKAAAFAQERGAQWIDLNMGCPVRKVVTKGAGAALLKEPNELAPLFAELKKAIEVPLTIKIRLGWDTNDYNAPEVVHIAKEEGITWVAIHGRTRAQQYTGLANWDLIEQVVQRCDLPIIGNGDLHHGQQVYDKLQETSCDGLMLARGPLKNPFIFLEAYLKPQEWAMAQWQFTAQDYWEVIERLFLYYEHYEPQEKVISVQMRKFITWYASGFPGASQFRQQVFQFQQWKEVKQFTQDYFTGLGSTVTRPLNTQAIQMTSVHG